jgi:acyl-coenzyme A synthetase/AMP-(fatty) acid ligase
LRQWVAAKLSKHLIPKYVFWIDEYPKTPSGKVQKFKLKEYAKEILGDGGEA